MHTPEEAREQEENVRVFRTGDKVRVLRGDGITIQAGWTVIDYKDDQTVVVVAAFGSKTKRKAVQVTELLDLNSEYKDPEYRNRSKE